MKRTESRFALDSVASHLRDLKVQFQYDGKLQTPAALLSSGWQDILEWRYIYEGNNGTTLVIFVKYHFITFSYISLLITVTTGTSAVCSRIATVTVYGNVTIDGIVFIEIIETSFMAYSLSMHSAALKTAAVRSPSRSSSLKLYLYFELPT